MAERKQSIEIKDRRFPFKAVFCLRNLAKKATPFRIALMGLASITLFSCGGNSTFKGIGFAVAQRLPSPNHYALTLDKKLIHFGKYGRTALDFKVSEEYRYYQTGDHLAVFHYLNPEVVNFFFGTDLVKKVHPIVGQLHFVEWNDGTVIGGALSGNLLEIHQFDTTGTALRSNTFDFPVVSGLYTQGKISSLIRNGTLMLWVPAFQKVLELDGNLELVDLFQVELPDAMVNFDGEVMGELADLMEKKSVAPLEAFCIKNSGALLQPKPVELLFYQNELHLAYNLLILDGFDGLEPILSKRILLFKMQGGSFQKSRELTGAHLAGLFDGSLLLTEFNSEKEHYEFKRMD